MQLLVYHNPGAGTGGVSRADLLAALRAEGVRATYMERGAEGDEPPADDTLIVAGGDGTVKRALELFGGAGRRFAILPLGGANNIVTGLGLPASIPAVARLFREGRMLPFRTGRLRWPNGEQAFAEAVGVGALARGAFEAKARMEMGGAENSDKIAVGRQSIVDVLANSQPVETTIAIDGRRLPDDTLFAEVLNVGVTGPSLRLADCVPMDGQITVAFIREGGRQAFRTALAREDALPTELRRGSEIALEWKGDALRVDDDLFMPPDAPVTLRIRRSREPSAMFCAPVRDETS